MLVSVLGIVLLVGIAWIATLYRSLPTLFGTETRVIRIGKDVPMIEGEYPDADDPSGPKPKWDKSTYHVGCGPTRDI
ncbi:hypothetical protein ACVW1A_002884 [Bradyrhizobium sp. LB1.3]